VSIAIDLETAIAPANPMQQVLRVRNFRLLWLGQGISWLGDQFYMIALPWLILQLTRDTLTLGTVLAVGGMAQASFMLLGGAVADRFSPRAIMLISDVVRFLLMVLLAALTLTGTVQLWMLYVFVFISGLVFGVFSPASGAMIPAVVEPGMLQAANSVSQGTLQVAMFVGPALAGGMIAALGNSSPQGLGLAFGFDALTFLASVLFLRLMSVPRFQKIRAEASAKMLESIKAGIKFSWHDPLLRLLFTVIIANNLVLGGALVVGMPVLADLRLAEGAGALGLVTAAAAAGGLIGVLLSGRLRRVIRFSGMGLLSVAFFGAALLGLAYVQTTWVAVLIMFGIGISAGYMNVMIPTLLQRRTPRQFLGRVMGLLYFSNLGLSPVSRAAAGGLVRFGLVTLFGGSGLLLILLAAALPFQPAFRSMDAQIEQVSAEHA
jgi:MFS family permease